MKQVCKDESCTQMHDNLKVELSSKVAASSIWHFKKNYFQIKKLIVFFAWLCCAHVLMAQPGPHSGTLIPINYQAHWNIASGTGTGTLTAPNPATVAQWHTAIDDYENGEDWMYSAVETNQKNLMCAGYSGAGVITPTIFKLNNIGMLVWSNPISPTSINSSLSGVNTSGQFYDVIKATDGYVAVGTISITGGKAVLIAEFDDNGNFLNNTPVAIFPSVSNIISGSNPASLLTGNYTVTSARGNSVALDPTQNSINHLIVGGIVSMTDPSSNSYNSAFITNVDLVSGNLTSGQTYVGGNYYNGADNSLIKVITDGSSSPYNVYACGYKSASSADNVTNSGVYNNNGTTNVTVYDKDAWLIKLQMNTSTPALSLSHEWTFNKSNLMAGSNALNSDPNYGSSIYQYQEHGPCTARNQWPKASGMLLPNSIAGDNFSPATLPLIAYYNLDERSTDLLLAADGKIAIMVNVNNIGNSNSGKSSISNGQALLSTLTDYKGSNAITGNGTYYDEYRDYDAFLVKIDPTDYTSTSFQGMNVGHFCGNDFEVSILQDKMGRYIIGGSTADTFSGSDANLPATIADPDGDGENALIVCTDDAHYNNNGSNASNDLWRRSFVAHDSREGDDVGTPQNDEDCFCLFCMAGTADDGYIIGGNNDNHTYDDWSITKFAPVNENILNTTSIGSTGQYNFFGGPSVPATYTLSTGTTHWDASSGPSNGSNIATLIIVPSGATLDIGDGSTPYTLNFASALNLYDYTQYPDWWGGRTFGSGILVEPGGTVDINDATLQGISIPQPSPNTGNDRNMWDGIVVQGDPTKSSGPSQGKVTFENSSVIQDAVFGIYAADNYRTFDITAGAYGTVPGFAANTYRSVYFGYGSLGGGIINASGSTFQNCRYGFTFQGYPNFHNTSYFDNCTFTTDATGMGDICLYTDGNGNNEPANTYGSAWAAYGMQFTGNTFTSDPSFPAYEQPTGLIAADAGMVLTHRCDLVNLGTGACMGYGSGNTFTNLNVGVRNSNEAGQSSYPMQMMYNNFDNNNTAIAVQDNMNGLQIDNNTITTPAYGTGIILAGCRGYQVALNTFNKCLSCGSFYNNFGIVVNDADDGNSPDNLIANEIQNNSFANTYYPSIALGSNDNNDGAGLQWHCNTYNANSMSGIGRISSFSTPFTPSSVPVDVYNSNGNMASPQGYCLSNAISGYLKTPAGNQFNATCYNNMYLYADANVSQNLIYDNNQTSTIFDPGTCYQEYSVVSPYPQIYNNQSCGTAVGNDATSIAESCPPPPTGNTPVDAANAMTHMDAVKDALRSVDSSTDPDTYNGLIAEYMYDIADVARYYSFTESFDSGGIWLENVGLYAQAFPFYIQAGDYTAAANVLTELPMNTYSDSLYAYLANLSYNLYSKGSGVSWLDLDSASRDTLVSLAQYNILPGYMVSVTDSILGTGPSLLPYPYLDSTLAVDSNAVDTSEESEAMRPHQQSPSIANVQQQSFSVYPNPTMGSLSIQTSQDGTLYLYTLLEQQETSYPLSTGQTDIILPKNLSAGVYMATFKPKDGSPGSMVRIVYSPGE